MRIEPRNDTEPRNSLSAHEIRQAHALGPELVCDSQYPDRNAATGCHRDFQAVLQRLSSEGALGPLMPLVAPLVFELKRLGIFHP